jgi:hypothetical protein
MTLPETGLKPIQRPSTIQKTNNLVTHHHLKSLESAGKILIVLQSFGARGSDIFAIEIT